MSHVTLTPVGPWVEIRYALPSGLRLDPAGHAEVREVIHGVSTSCVRPRAGVRRGGTWLYRGEHDVGLLVCVIADIIEERWQAA